MVLADESSDKGKEASTDVVATLETNFGKIKVKLYHKRVPKTVSNFVELVNKGFYDGLSFHRIVAKFVIQGGDPNGNGTGGPGYKFDDEFHHELKHNKKGLLSMANSGVNTNGSQFFITLGVASHLDGKHAVFGEVISGMDVVDKIAAVKVDARSAPRESVLMKKVTVTNNFTPVPFKKYHSLKKEDVQALTTDIAMDAYNALSAVKNKKFPVVGEFKKKELIQFRSDRQALLAVYMITGSESNLQVYIQGVVSDNGGGSAESKGQFTLKNLNFSFIPQMGKVVGGGSEEKSK
ncbi:MAG: peptidylprolyl isomerase [Proteobacteria bacterium]|nr:peptidylprolyl isomerase [Pseudomonadota bacterium]